MTSTATEFELYGYWRTSATFRVRVAIAPKGPRAEERFVNVDAGEHRSEAFLRINPMGAIPALVQAGHPPLTQSMAILAAALTGCGTPPHSLYLSLRHPSAQGRYEVQMEPPAAPRPSSRFTRGRSSGVRPTARPFATPASPWTAGCLRMGMGCPSGCRHDLRW
jgi:Glutathione S-transferase, N-terminal domain